MLIKFRFLISLCIFAYVRSGITGSGIAGNGLRACFAYEVVCVQRSVSPKAG